MSATSESHPQPVYAVPEQPRDLTDQDLVFISEYTGQSADKLRHNIMHVWQQAKQKASKIDVTIVAAADLCMHI